MCPPGSFGFDCLSKCNTYCTGNELCNYITGICDEGCKEGWDGPLCTTGKCVNSRQNDRIRKNKQVKWCKSGSDSTLVSQPRI